MQQELDSLNDAQKEAVLHTEGPALILAGAGSGKTRVLITKVRYLIEAKNVSPENIMMVTFTNKAAGEMKERMGRPLGYIGTFHAFCAMQMRRHAPRIGFPNDFTIYDQDDQKQLIQRCLKKMATNKTLTPSGVLARISSIKDNMMTPEQYLPFAQGNYDQLIAALYVDYQKALKEANAMDFDDLLLNMVLLLKNDNDVLAQLQEQYHYFLIDEFQDTNAAQYMLAILLSQKSRNISVVGDFSQSIYSWRGADLRNLHKFQENFPDAKTYYLEVNYRSTESILSYANKLISHNTSHPVLSLTTTNDTGEEVAVLELTNEEEEALYVAETIEQLCAPANYDKAAILYRMNAQSRVIEEALLHLGIPYVLVGGTRFYERKEVKDVLAYLNVWINPKDEVSYKRIEKLGKGRLKRFLAVRDEYQEKEHPQSDELIGLVIERTGYLDLYNDTNSEDIARLENIRELRSVAQHFPAITEFLHQVALVESEYSENEKNQKNKRGVSLMTLHQAKGLEFDYICIVGLEDGILPHSRALYSTEELEEERRLFYVGVTRARKRLYITHAKRRFLFGRSGYTIKSRFLNDNEDEYNWMHKSF
ncbi:MAG: ATP-dependent DNA helicase PcrA [Microgenomates bacterium OLB22]|nr:MAG: ATP-dependent DNA helicase PcrA [Microgenomates bacterium OLB22]